MDNFNIEDIAEICGIEVLRRKNEIYAVCPFCGDRRGKFSYTIQKGSRKNVYNCFRCGEHGSGVDLYIKLSSEDYSGKDGIKKAIKDIQKQIGVENSSDRHRTTTYVAPEEAEMASAETCSKVYYTMLNLLELKPEHKSDLLRRGLTEEDIKRFRFRSTPDNAAQFCKRLYTVLKKHGVSLKGVPGFYRMQNGYWTMKIPGKGYFCPVYKGNHLLGFQIRVDEPKDGAKYLWFSSAGKKDGVSSGSPVTFLKGEHKEVVIVTEGVLKATVIYSLLRGKFSIVGAPGVNTLTSLNPIFSKYEKKGFVFEAFDMDKHYEEKGFELLSIALKESGDTPFGEFLKTDDMKGKNDRRFHSLFKAFRIMQASEKLCTKAEEYGMGVHPLTWDTIQLPINGTLQYFWRGNFKGLDDFLLEYDDKERFISYIQNLAEKRKKLTAFLSMNKGTE